MKSAGLSSNAGSSAVMFIGPAVRLSPDDFIANSNKTEKNYAVNCFKNRVEFVWKFGRLRHSNFDKEIFYKEMSADFEVC